MVTTTTPTVQDICHDLLDNELQPLILKGDNEKDTKARKHPAVSVTSPLFDEILTTEELDTLLNGQPVNSRTDADGKVLQHFVRSYDQSKLWIGIVCGKPSGNLEVIDIDVKNDPTGNIAQEYFELIKENNPDLFARLTIVQTISKGFHIYYRSPERITTKEIPTRSETGQTMIEKQGQGCYAVCPPSKGYKFTQGGFDEIPYISLQERSLLLGLAQSLNKYKTQASADYRQKKKGQTTVDGYEITSLEDYDQRGNPLEVLYEKGWTFVEKKGDRTYLLRPAGKMASDTKHSANWHEQHRTLTIWSTSVPELEKYQQSRNRTDENGLSIDDNCMSASSIFCFFNCDGNWKKTAKLLGEMGYGKKKPDDSMTIEDLGEEILVKVTDQQLKGVLIDLIENHKKYTKEADDQNKLRDILKQAGDLVNKGKDNNARELLKRHLSNIETDDVDLYHIVTSPVTIDQDHETYRNLPPMIDTGYFISGQPMKMVNSQINLIAGGTGHLKTTLLSNIVYNIATADPGGAVYYFSLEQPDWRIRSYIQQLHLNEPDLLIKGKLYEEAIERYKTKGDLSLFREHHRATFKQSEADLFNTYFSTGRIQVTSDSRLNDVVELCKIIRQLAEKQKVKAVCIDYIQRLRLPSGHNNRGNSRQETMKEICDILNDCAGDTGIPFIITSQLNRKGYEHHHSLVNQNISEAGDIERACETIFMIWNNNITPMISKFEPDGYVWKSILRDKLFEPNTCHIKVTKHRGMQTDEWENIPLTIKSRRIHPNPKQ